MIERLRLFLRRPASIDIAINTLGNYLNVFFSAFFVFLFARVLSRSEMGVFSVLFGIAYVLANILDFGTTATIYSYLPPLITEKKPELYRFLKSTFFYQSIFSLLIVGILFVIFPFLDTVFFKTGAPLYELYLTAISVLFFVWQNFLLNCLFAAKRVVQANLYLNVANIVKTLVIIVVSLLHTISIGWVMVTFGLIGPIVFFALVFFNKKTHIKPIFDAPIHKEDFRFDYTFTYFVASQFFNLGLRMDLFLLSYYLTKDVVGYYGLAQKIILTILATVISITQVLSPSFTNLKSKKEIFAHLKSGFLYMLIPTGLFLALAITPTQIFVLFFTEKFVQTATVSHLLALPFLIYPALSLLHLLFLYTFKKPVYILIGNIILFVSITGGCYFFIPRFGYMAAVMSITVGFILSGGFLLFSTGKEFKKRDHSSISQK